mmetsp:Transcript_108770/g.347161  ORF Transcript_108770/g.347161 Transcript_108770/m.347161 type:complete len:278 (-) Transcript_108770:2608-3441(-)
MLMTSAALLRSFSKAQLTTSGIRASTPDCTDCGCHGKSAPKSRSKSAMGSPNPVASARANCPDEDRQSSMLLTEAPATSSVSTVDRACALSASEDDARSPCDTASPSAGKPVAKSGRSIQTFAEHSSNDRATSEEPSRRAVLAHRCSSEKPDSILQMTDSALLPSLQSASRTACGSDALTLAYRERGCHGNSAPDLKRKSITAQSGSDCANMHSPDCHSCTCCTSARQEISICTTSKPPEVPGGASSTTSTAMANANRPDASFVPTSAQEVTSDCTI